MLNVAWTGETAKNCPDFENFDVAADRRWPNPVSNGYALMQVIKLT
jgi:hypothetical protein